jgi:hypothetical protein
MTTEEAIALANRVANRVKPLRRVALDKLAGNARAQHVSDVAALAKSYNRMGNSLSGMTAKLSKLAADVVLLENHPHAPWRLN